MNNFFIYLSPCGLNSGAERKAAVAADGGLQIFTYWKIHTLPQNGTYVSASVQLKRASGVPFVEADDHKTDMVSIRLGNE
jgi:hypothetical protein